MNFIITYFLAYILSLLGYFLGNATDEEHKEIKKFVNIFKDLLVIVTYLLLFYVFNSSVFLFILAANLILKLLSFKFHNYYLTQIHNIIFLGLSILILNKFHNEYLFLAILPILILFFDKSFDKFNLKLELYQMTFYLLLYFLIRF